MHEAIAEAITCGVTEVRVEEFPPYLDKLELIQEDGDNNLLETEFKVNFGLAQCWGFLEYYQ